jgi:hypothetical protein
LNQDNKAGGVDQSLLDQPYPIMRVEQVYCLGESEHLGRMYRRLWVHALMEIALSGILYANVLVMSHFFAAVKGIAKRLGD